MADAYTSYLNLVKPEVNSSRDTWGEKGNLNWDALDTFAKRVDKLATDALSRTVTTQQTVASALVVAELSTFRKGINSEAGMLATGSIIAGGTVQARNGNLQACGMGGDYTRGQVTLNEGGTRGLVWDGTQYGLIGADLFVNGKRALLTGDVDFGPYYNKNAVGGQTVLGNPLIQKENPEYQMVWGGVARLGMGIIGDGRWRIRNIDNDDTFLTVNSDGSIWTKQFGDLNNRIEGRASDFANAAATNVGNQRVVSVALQGSWALPVGPGQYSAGHPGVMTGVGIGSNGLFQNITGRYLYFNTPNQGWVGAASI